MIECSTPSLLGRFHLVNISSDSPATSAQDIGGSGEAAANFSSLYLVTKNNVAGIIPRGYVLCDWGYNSYGRGEACHDTSYTG